MSMLILFVFSDFCVSACLMHVLTRSLVLSFTSLCFRFSRHLGIYTLWFSFDDFSDSSRNLSSFGCSCLFIGHFEYFSQVYIFFPPRQVTLSSFTGILILSIPNIRAAELVGHPFSRGRRGIVCSTAGVRKGDCMAGHGASACDPLDRAPPKMPLWSLFVRHFFKTFNR